eukprot:Tbor_TRINITY_DN4413_c0_g1::TRINITY_DN4413_c0_g1_i1::g.7946::m.7946/K05956/RABGGTB; geranylgeranyl transferase type-2 subunit beta
MSVDSLQCDLHTKFIHSLDEKKDSIHFWTSRHLRISGIYWAMGALYVLDRLNEFNKDNIIKFALSCYNAKDGGFGGNENQDSHMLYTLSAVQVICMFGGEEQMDKEAIGKWVASMQQPDGSFSGDVWGEIDTRFTYCALNCLSLLGSLHLVDIKKAAAYILSCQNWDGGFGVGPGAESHAGQIFCCLGALCIAGELDRIDKNKLGFWLAARQLPCGGLNGRPEKKADVCYSWWVVSSLSMIDRLHWISRDDLFKYILMCQDLEDGGIADKPDNQPDVYHTFFGVAGLSLLGFKGAKLNSVNPVYAMPFEVLDRLKIEECRGLNVGR